jgi:hypothetical protein
MTLRAYIRRLHGLWSKADKLEIAKRRARLRGRIDAFNDVAPMFLRGTHRLEDLKDDMIALDDEATDDEDDPFAPPDLESYVGEAELIALRLPSTMGRDICLKLKLNDIIDTEFSLRKGQANDALGGLRQSIGEKSFMYRENLRPAKGIKQTTRARSRITAVDRTLTMHRCVYALARRALLRLAADSATISAEYQPVTRADLKASSIIYNISEPGSRHSKLAWFWSTNEVNSEAAEGELLTECEITKLCEVRSG